MVSIIGHAERSPIMPVTLPHSVKKLLQDGRYVGVFPQESDSRLRCCLHLSIRTSVPVDEPFYLGAPRLSLVSSEDRELVRSRLVVGGIGPKMRPWT